MKIVTYNLNGVRARLPRLIEYLDERKPDALCLQEIKCDDDSFPIGDIRAAGYDGIWHGQKGFNGVAILAPAGVEVALRRQGLPGDPDDTHSRYIEAEIGGVTIASIYLPNGNPVGTEKFAYKLAWMERLRAHGVGRADAARKPPGPAPDLEPWLYRCSARPLSARRALHFLGLYRRLLAARRGLSNRPSLALPPGRRPSARRRRRQGISRPGEGQRSCADLGRDRIIAATGLNPGFRPPSHPVHPRAP